MKTKNQIKFHTLNVAMGYKTAYLTASDKNVKLERNVPMKNDDVRYFAYKKKSTMRIAKTKLVMWNKRIKNTMIDLGSLGYCGGRKLCGIQIQIKGKLAGAEYYLHSYSFYLLPS